MISLSRLDDFKVSSTESIWFHYDHAKYYIIIIIIIMYLPYFMSFSFTHSRKSAENTPETSQPQVCRKIFGRSNVRRKFPLVSRMPVKKFRRGSTVTQTLWAPSAS